MNPADQERQPEPTGDEQEPDYRFTLGQRADLPRLDPHRARVDRRWRRRRSAAPSWP
jgi:hypothetical protein